MKKIITILILIILIIPFGVNATNPRVFTISTTGNYDTKEGEELKINFNIGINGLTKNTYNTYSLILVEFEIEIDNDILDITGVDNSVWDTKVYDRFNGKYLFYSVYNAIETEPNSCIDGLGYCGSYTMPVSFFVKKSEKQETRIKMLNATATFVDLSKDLNNITEDDILTSQHLTPIEQIINIEKTEQDIGTSKPIKPLTEEVPNIETVEKLPEKVTNNKEKSDPKKIENTKVYLKSLEIKNYEINFDKNIFNYEIDINSDVNELTVIAKPEDETSTVEIIGDKNLKDNIYQVLIIVKDKDNNENTYTISANVKEKEIVKKDDDKKKENKTKKIFDIKKIKKKDLIIGGCIIASIIITITVLTIRSNKKIEKALKF